MEQVQLEHRPKLPFGVGILAFLTIVCGLLNLLWGMLAAGAGGVSWLAGLFTFAGDVRRWGAGTFGGGVLNLLTGVVQLYVGFALFRRRRWAWMVAAICAALSLIPPLKSLLDGHLWALFGMIIPGAIFYYLTRRNVRNAFRPVEVGPPNPP